MVEAEVIRKIENKGRNEKIRKVVNRRVFLCCNLTDKRYYGECLIEEGG